MDSFAEIIDNNTPYFVFIGICFLLIILVLLAIALAKTINYYVERFPQDEKDQKDYFNYRAQVEDLKAQKDTLQKSIASLSEQYENKLKEAKEHLADGVIRDDLQAELEKLERRIETARQDLSSSMAEYYKSKNEADLLTGMLPNLQETKDSAQKELERIKNDIAELTKPDGEYAKKKSELKQIREDVSELTREYSVSKLSVDDLKNKVARLEEDERELLKRKKEQQKDKERIDKADEELGKKLRESRRLDQDLAEKRIEVALLDSKMTKLEADNKETEQTSAQFIEGYRTLMTPPESLAAYARAGADKFEDETAELNRFQAFLSGSGYFFSDRTIRAFHTALKIQDANPLTVLAGISGTGKTLLPTKYAEFFGIYSLILPVEPRWDSPQDLLGFYNYLEKKYQSTELARTLVAFDPVNSFDKAPRRRGEAAQEVAEIMKNRMVIVLLDEMNLARTEYYFANFLSKLELRRTVSDVSNRIRRKDAEITLDSTFGNIYIPGNVLFVGTMNEDDSTQTLSDKVLDRANILRFGKPNPENMENAANAASQRQERRHAAMSYKIFKSWQKNSFDDTAAGSMVEKTITKLNDAMTCINKPFGFRVHDAIRQYVANYPMTESNDIYFALADQIEQKIMPKLRGLDLAENTTRDCLDAVDEILAGLSDDKLCEAFRRAREDEANTGMFMWQGVSR